MAETWTKKGASRRVIEVGAGELLVSQRKSEAKSVEFRRSKMTTHRTTRERKIDRSQVAEFAYTPPPPAMDRPPSSLLRLIPSLSYRGIGGLVQIRCV